MNFEELETLWVAQQPAHAPAGHLPALKQSLQPELKRRSRFFAYHFFVVGLALVLTPLLAVANARYLAPHDPGLYWARAALVEAALLAFLVGSVRQWRRHRALAAADTETLAAFAAQSLAVIESEMNDYRLALRLLPVGLGLTVLSIYVNQPVTHVGWTPLLLRLTSVLAFLLVVGAVCWRHYHRNLAPEHARRKQVLADLS